MLPQERTAWVWITALCVVFGTYFLFISVLQESAEQVSFLTRIGMLATALTTLGLVAGAEKLIATARTNSADTPFDERDELIKLRSSAISYYVLMAGMIIVGCVMPFSTGGWDIVHAALFAILVAEIVHSIFIVIGYRRGLHV